MRNEKLRLVRINAPEIRPLPRRSLWPGLEGIWINVNDALVAAGHAVYQEY